MRGGLSRTMRNVKFCEDCDTMDDADREDSSMSVYPYEEDGEVWLCDRCAYDRDELA